MAPSVIAEDHGAPALYALNQDQISSDDTIVPEIAEVSQTSFQCHKDKVVISLTTTGGEVVQFALRYDKFMLGVTAAVAFMNTHIAQFFNAVGFP